MGLCAKFGLSLMALPNVLFPCQDSSCHESSLASLGMMLECETLGNLKQFAEVDSLESW